MGHKRVELRQDGGHRLIGRTDSGHEVVMDNAQGNTGPRPTELVLVAVAGCTAMDVIDIMTKKRQVMDRYSIEVTGDQREEAPNVYLSVVVEHVVEGDVETAALRRSIELSATKYCTVSAQLASGVARVSHRYRIVRPAGATNGPSQESGEVVVEGPHANVLGVASGA